MPFPRWSFAFVFAFILAAGVTSAQTIQVDKQNRTIELTTQASIEVEADLVSITVGYHNWGPTHDAAYNENMRIADQILKSWTNTGIPQKDISTSELSSNPVADNELNAMTPAGRKEKQYEAVQTWSITSNPTVAQQLIDLAVAAGANYVTDPSWQLSDPDSADDKAYSAALEEARSIADRMARSFGGKVGALLYATNQNRVFTQLSYLTSGQIASTQTATVGTRQWPPLHPVKLLPQRIHRSAMVRAIFALE
jgi:uncharacterized protein